MYLLTHPFFYFFCYSLIVVCILLADSCTHPLDVEISHGFTWEGFPGGSMANNPPANARDTALIPGLGRPPGEGKQQPTPIFLPGKSPGQRNLVGYGPWSQKRIGQDLATKHTHIHTHTHFTLRPLLHILHSLLSIWLTLLASLSIYDSSPLSCLDFSPVLQTHLHISQWPGTQHVHNWSHCFHNTYFLFICSSIQQTVKFKKWRRV